MFLNLNLSAFLFVWGSDMNINKITMREKLEVAEFYADEMSGHVLELRRNTAAISTPAGLEHWKYWELREFKRQRDSKYKRCLEGISSIFKKLKGLNHG